MEHTYWLKQTADEPLFPDILWSRPENKRTAGKLLIVGGNAHGFAAPAEAYQVCTASGIGTIHILLPDSLKKTVGIFLPEADFAPSTPSGSFAKQAIAELLDASSWADAVLLAGDLGRNSETAITLESFVKKYSGPLIITKDSADYFKETALEILKRPKTMAVVSLAQLQRMFISAAMMSPITHGMDLLHLVDALHNLTVKYPIIIVTRHLNHTFVAFSGQVSTTPADPSQKIWRLKTAARASVFWLQNSDKSFEAVTASLNH